MWSGRVRRRSRAPKHLTPGPLRVSRTCGVNRSGLFRNATTSLKCRIPNTRRSSATAASDALSAGTSRFAIFCRRAQAAIDSAPRTGRMAPSSDNSPTKRCSSLGPTVPIAPKIPRAIGRSNPAPSLRTLAGARLIVTLLLGYPNPELSSADLIRSRLSRTAVSGIPTVMKLPLVPGYISTSTSTRYASMPYTAADRVRNRAMYSKWPQPDVSRTVFR